MTHNHKVGSSTPTIAACTRKEKGFGFITFATGGSTVVKHLPYNPKDDGSNPVVCIVAFSAPMPLCTASELLHTPSFQQKTLKMA